MSDVDRALSTGRSWAAGALPGPERDTVLAGFAWALHLVSGRDQGELLAVLSGVGPSSGVGSDPAPLIASPAPAVTPAPAVGAAPVDVWDTDGMFVVTGSAAPDREADVSVPPSSSGGRAFSADLTGSGRLVELDEPYSPPEP